jgi:predicted dehydrogenase
MKVRIGIVGCGAIAENLHIPAVLSHELATLSALVDTDLDRCRRLAARHDVRQIADRLEGVANSVDAVILATPPHTHRAIAEDALARGLHLLCEKPLANTVLDCEAMTAAARRAGRVLAATHMFRFYPVRRQLPDLVRQHGLGKIRKVVASEGKPYSWPTVTGYTVRREMVPGGVLINAGVHTLDTLIWWFGDPTGFSYEDDSVGGLESNVRMRLEFPGGVTVTFRQSRTCSLPYEIRVVADHGEIAFHTNSVLEYTVRKSGSPARHQCISDVSDGMDWARLQLDDFIECTSGNAEPFVSGIEATRVIRLVESCYASKRARPLPSHAPLPGATW